MKPIYYLTRALLNRKTRQTQVLYTCFYVFRSSIVEEEYRSMLLMLLRFNEVNRIVLAWKLHCYYLQDGTSFQPRIVGFPIHDLYSIFSQTIEKGIKSLCVFIMIVSPIFFLIKYLSLT